MKNVIDMEERRRIGEDLEHIKKHIKKGGKTIFCGILFDDPDNITQRFYYVSHDMDVRDVFGEMELWKMDIKEHMEYPSQRISAYIKLEDESNEFF